MIKDNITGKNKDFYDLGKKIFDRLNPQGAINPKVVEHVEPKREWVGLTEAERVDILDAELTTQSTEHFALAQAIEAKLKEKNGEK